MENYCKNCKKIVYGKNVKLNGITRFCCNHCGLNEPDYTKIQAKETAEKRQEIREDR